MNLIKTFQQTGLIESNADYPQIIINSIPAKELVNSEIDDLTIGEYIDGLRELDLMKCDFIAILCNTAYKHLNEFQKAITAPIIDLPKLVEKYLRDQKINKVTIIGSQNLVKNRVFNF